MADESLKNMGYILHCFECFHRETAKTLFIIERSGKCSECGSKLNVAGPLWLGKIVDEKFCNLVEEELEKRTFRLKERLEKILNLIKGEVNAPITYYVVDKICDKLAIPVPSVKKILNILREEGFQACLTHFNFGGVKANASAMDMKEILQKIATSNYGKF
jgi:tRNA (guanine26-N2/guanine27-N2)-dimethyltransferase